MSVTPSHEESIARAASITALTTRFPFEVSYSRHPVCPHETVTFTSTDESVGVLKYFVQIKPEYCALSDQMFGYKVTKHHERQEDATIVETGLDIDKAIFEAQETMRRLVE